MSSNARTDGDSLIPKENQVVSICLPVFNGSKHLPEALDSALAQTYSNFELLISDDCSRDNSAKIIEEYARRDSRIRVLHNERNLGLFANYNRCMHEAVGEFIKPFAQDDLLHPEALTSALDVFSFDPSIVLVSMNKLHIDERGEVVSPQREAFRGSSQRTPADIDSGVKHSRSVEGTEVLKQCLANVKNEIGEPSTVIFRADCKGTGFDESFRHLGDLEYWLRILMHGSYAFIETPLCSYRLHENSATSINKKLLLDSVELLRLGRLYGPALAAMEGSRANFFERSMNAIFSESIAAVEAFSPVINTQGINLSDDAKKLVAAVPSEEYFELALRVLERLHCVASLNVFGSVKRDRTERIRELEKQFSEYLNSRSWRMSRHLREISKLVSGGDNDDAFSSSIRDKFQEQEVYETFLENQIWRLENSLSWRITSPIRQIEKRFGSNRSIEVAVRRNVREKT